VELAKALIEENYVSFGPTLAQKKLIQLHGLDISVSSVRNLMTANGLWSERQKQKKNIPQLRERKAKKGDAYLSKFIKRFKLRCLFR
jgi:hypothetical protein